MRKIIIKYLLYFIGFSLLGFGLWTHKYFGKVTVDQALTTLVFSTHGAVTGNASFTRRLIEWCFLTPACLTLVMISLPLMRSFFQFLSMKDWIVKPCRSIFVTRFYITLIITGVGLIIYQYSLVSYALHQHKPRDDYFASHYIDPANVKITTKRPKSLVLIYVESLETTYSNAHIFDNNLLRRLTHLDARHLSYARYHQMPGTSWSIAGIVATQCAVPLKLVRLFNQNQPGQALEHILPKAKCLGDILADFGYRNVYLNGSALEFAGVGKFMADHHYTELYGREEWLAEGVIKPEALTAWGLPDDMLLDQAKIKLAELVKDGQPFNLTLFTIDTHGLSGQLTDSCARRGYHDFPGIVECTANQVADFIHYVKQQGWLDSVTIVVVGDHLAMKNLASHELDSSPSRFIFNMIVSNDNLSKNTEDIVHFDMLPTILTALNFKIEGGRLGLGYTALGDHVLEQPDERILELQQRVLYESQRYNELWR